jgi:Bax inhibitor 1
MTCALGMYMNAYTVLSGFMMSVAAMIGMAYMTYKISNVYESESLRLGYLKALSFCMGFLVGPLMHHLAEFEPMILIQAVSYTAIMFCSFTAISLFSKRRSYLFLGGIIMTMTSCMFWYRTMAWMFGYSRFGGEFGLVYTMSGLFVACLYVIYDTQLIIERAERGDKDVPKHSMILFLDLFELFIKVVQILIKLNDQDKKKEKKRRN